ncbi:MAG: tripartite tricarboxylate transporter substrate binding protein [Zhengella sp.]|uniref:tripartite tricarboxylate transporter substrate binding protein n=1 Tax=Zhengella sp. TaxID=2282762 RepID=UPI00352928F0|nr:tripartite tricarboxylate transporter substrate binding protein [Brucellaceae bacterium]
MKLKSLVLAAIFSLMAAGHALAEWAPSGPIRLQIGFGAGGETDTIGRVIAKKMAEDTGWTIVAENKPGGGGLAMFTQVAVMKPDGQTIGLGVSMPVLVNLVLRGDELPFDLDSFDYLGTAAYAQLAIVARADAPFDDLQGLIDHAKANDGALIGFDAKPQELLLNLVARESGAELKPVSMKSSAEQIQNVLGGHVIASFSAGAHIPYLESGDLKMIASANATRHGYAKDVATVQEQGFDIYVDPYFYFAAPAGLPEDARKALTDALSGAIASQEVTSAINNAFKADPTNLGPEGTRMMMDKGLDNVAKLFGK